ncbi:MAG: hypothetical protein FWE07_05755 [Turicibacter sp.]|nr:hypothetical protein [Turicibacter sp.]
MDKGNSVNSSLPGFDQKFTRQGNDDARLTKVKRNAEPLVETDSHKFFATKEQLELTTTRTGTYVRRS